MTALEDRLRDATSAAAELVTTTSVPAAWRVTEPVAMSPAGLARQRWYERGVPRGDVPQGGASRGGAQRGGEARRRARWLVPALIAVVVLLVVGGTVLLPRVVRQPDRTPATTGAPAVSPARYFVTNMGGAGTGYMEIAVRDALTGEVTDSVPPPGGTEFSAVSATADPRVFYVTGNAGLVAARAYRLTIDAAGKVVSLSEVNTGSQPWSGGSFAASSDGRRLAYPAPSPVTNGKLPPAGIDVVDVRTGHATHFTADRPGGTTDLSWSTDGRYLAFQFSDMGYKQPADKAGLWLLDTTGPGGDLLANARRVVSWRAGGNGYASSILSGDGETIYAIDAQQRADGTPVTRVIELDAATGKQLRILFERPYVNHGNTVWTFFEMALDPSSRLLMVVDGAGGAYRVDIATTHATRIPFPRGTMPNSIAW
ncbi:MULTISPECIES: hypothetical protein [Pseudofrankia]|uniref:hypothetical protein n=1 Tax=Pseudofrankia TaxID=2994363 RepID=UPI000234B673|nr:MULTISPECIES: hypothetical protein [Pseudofrankia]OHV40569.1 hypothetical protein BCD49_08350 [Pseudofrankia sp. EUN1h]